MRSFAQEQKTQSSFDRYINKSLKIGNTQALSLGIFNGGLGIVAQAALGTCVLFHCC